MSKDLEIDRRREERITAVNSRFSLKKGNLSCVCEVVNLSRMGLGITLQNSLEGATPIVSLKIGDEVCGTLFLDEESLDVNATVRVRKGNFLGLEYKNISSDFLLHVQKLLTPQYIAASIQTINKNALASDIECAFRGDEFEVVVFKKGSSLEKFSMQIFAKGLVVEVNDDGCRFVPSPLMRASSLQGSWDFVSEFSSYQNEVSSDQSKPFLEHVDKVLRAWKDCPEEVKNSFSKAKKNINK